MSEPAWRKSTYSSGDGNCLQVVNGIFRKSSHSGSNGNCLEAAPAWVKSSYSTNNGACVEWHRSSACAERECAEVAACGHRVAVRDSKLGDRSPVLKFGTGAWEAFTASLKAA